MSISNSPTAEAVGGAAAPHANNGADMARKARTRAPVHPGAIVEEAFRDELRMSLRQAAAAVGLSPTGLQKVFEGKSPVTPETALRLEAALGLDADHWLRMQAEYDLHHARKRMAGSLAKIQRAKRPA